MRTELITDQSINADSIGIKKQFLFIICRQIQIFILSPKCLENRVINENVANDEISGNQGIQLRASRGEMMYIFLSIRTPWVHWFHRYNDSYLIPICTSRYYDVSMLLAGIKCTSHLVKKDSTWRVLIKFG